MKNKLLSVVVPTYNRSAHLDLCLAYLVPLVRQYSISIYISDNASTDQTRQVVAAWMEQYEHLCYRCNEKNHGADGNFELALKMPDSKFVWLLGDTYQLTRDCLEHQMALLRRGEVHDLFVYNIVDRVKTIPSKAYSDSNALLLELGWHMTCMSALVFSADLIREAQFARYRNTNFLQMGIVFEYISDRKFRIGWSREESVIGLSIDNVPKVGWHNKTFEIWVDAWVNFVFSLPASYTLDAKLRCIKAHGRLSGLFTYRNLLHLRMSGILSADNMRGNVLFFELVMAVPILFLRLLVWTPLPALRYLVSFKRRLLG